MHGSIKEVVTGVYMYLAQVLFKMLTWNVRALLHVSIEVSQSIIMVVGRKLKSTKEKFTLENHNFRQQICEYIYVCVCMCMCVWVYVCMYVYMCIYMYACMCVCVVCVCVYVCVCVCIYVCVCMSRCVYSGECYHNTCVEKQSTALYCSKYFFKSQLN